MDDDTNEQSAPFSPHFRVWLCGAFRVERRVGATYEGVRTAEWGGSNYPRLLLKALLCCPGRQARREALLEMLWPETDPEQAAHYLNTATTKLRKVLQPVKGQASLLLTEDDCRLYRLEGQHLLWVDADAALTLLKEAERIGRRSPHAVALLEEAVTSLSQGAFLEDEEGLWLYGRRTLLAEALYNGRRWVAEAYAEHGSIGQAELHWRALLATDPTDEEVLRQALEQFHRHGMAQKAWRLYHQVVEQAAEDGLDLTPETEALAQRLRQEPSAVFQRYTSPEQGVPHAPPAVELSTEAVSHQGRTSERLRPDEKTQILLANGGIVSIEAARTTEQQRYGAFSFAGEHPSDALLPSLLGSLSKGQQVRSQEPFIPSAPLIGDALMHRVLTLPISVIEPQPSSEMVPDFTTQFGIMCAQILTLVQHWYGMARFYHALQDHVDQQIKKLDLLKSLSSLETYTLSRRSFLTTLAALPATSLASRKQVHTMSLDVEELLPQCAASITSCWHLSGGSHLDAIGPIIDSYVPALIAIMKNAPSYREVAADLVAQCYFLKAILAWHVQGLTVAEAYCLQSLYYSDMAQNINLRLTALNQHALISYYAKQFPKALAKSEEASAILQRTPQEHIFPIVQGRVFMYLAAFQAQQSSADAEQTLEQARHAFDLQATVAEPVPLYADCGDASLTLWEGLTQYHLSLHDATHAERALLSLRTFGRLQSAMEIPERFRLECLTNRILAASQCHEMEEAIDCLEAAHQGSKALESKQRSAEVESAFQNMLQHWPNEKQVQHLTALLYAKE
ncbi:MAG: hypothetical protein H0U76_21405 [Ktedonobacteraceae bacterium]|nr:hypothetical protein [Ktedonobacteraceae bacterium]